MSKSEIKQIVKDVEKAITDSKELQSRILNKINDSLFKITGSQDYRAQPSSEYNFMVLVINKNFGCYIYKLSDVIEEIFNLAEGSVTQDVEDILSKHETLEII